MGSKYFQAEDEHDEHRQQQGEHRGNQAPAGGFAIFLLGVDQHRDQRAGKRAAGDQAEQCIRQAEGGVVSVRLRRDPELRVEQDLPNRAQRRRQEKGGHQNEAGLADGELAGQQPAQAEVLGQREAEALEAAGDASRRRPDLVEHTGG